MRVASSLVPKRAGSSGEGIWIIKLKSGNYCSLGLRVLEFSRFPPL